MRAITSLQVQLDLAHGKKRWHLKKAIIETWQQAYLLKGSRQSVGYAKPGSQIRTIAAMEIPEEIYFNQNQIPHSDSSLSTLNMEHISFLLQYYQLLKQESWEDLHCDMRWHLIDLENLVSDALEEDYPLLWDIVIWKVDGRSNKQIRELALQKYGEDHSEQYYSTAWSSRIPRLVMEERQKQYLEWYYTNVERGYWKKCSKCGTIKLGHPLFFAKNSSKDGFYSQCKDCKNGKEHPRQPKW